MQPILVAEDRSLAVPPGERVRTGYAAVDQLKFACRARMAVGDVDRAYQRRLQLGDHQPFPCPRGHWEGEPETPDARFVIADGRHDAIAALMLGQDYILVAWGEAAPAASGR